MRLVIKEKEYDLKMKKIFNHATVKHGPNPTASVLAAEFKKIYIVFEKSNFANLKKEQIDAMKWDTYSTKHFSHDDPTELEHEKRSFTNFFCGYLQYYDDVVRRGYTDHALYLDWDSVTDHVVVYIDPKPIWEVQEPEFLKLTPAANVTSGGEPVSPKPPPPPQ